MGRSRRDDRSPSSSESRSRRKRKSYRRSEKSKSKRSRRDRERRRRERSPSSSSSESDSRSRRRSSKEESKKEGGEKRASQPKRSRWSTVENKNPTKPTPPASAPLLGPSINPALGIRNPLAMNQMNLALMNQHGGANPMAMQLAQQNALRLLQIRQAALANPMAFQGGAGLTLQQALQQKIIQQQTQAQAHMQKIQAQRQATEMLAKQQAAILAQHQNSGVAVLLNKRGEGPEAAAAQVQGIQKHLQQIQTSPTAA